MIAPNRASYGCCGAPALPPFQHKCKGGAAPVVSPTKHRAQAAESVRRPPLGRAAEDALAAALEADGFRVRTFPAWLWAAVDGALDIDCFVREWPVGAMCEPARGWRCDFFRPRSRTVVEVDGDAHAVKRQRRNDVLRRQAIEAARLCVVSVLPEQCGPEAVEIVKRAIGAKE